MAVVNTKSAPLVAADSDPQETTHSYEANGSVRASCGAVEIAAGDSNGSVFRMVRLPSNARIVDWMVNNDTMTGATDYDLGLYVVDDGAVVDKDILADGLNLATGAAHTKSADSILGPEKVNDRLWELAGETTDPGGQYDVCLTANAVGSAAGDASLEVLWTN